MSDPRIKKYRNLTVAMQHGLFNVGEDHESNDEVGQLGHALIELAKSMESWHRDQGLLTKITEKINQGVFMEDVLDFVYEAFQRAIPYNRIGFAVLDEEGILRARWARSDALEIKINEGFSQYLKDSSLAKIMETGEPRILNDLEDYLLNHPDSISTQLIVEEGVRSSLTCPLLALGKPVGFIFFSSNEKNTYQNIHQDIFRRIANQLAVTVEKSRLYEDLYRLNKELSEARDALEHQANHDVLTGLWNRRAIMQLGDKEIARVRRTGHSATVFMADIDYFKKVNDTYGHQAGDDVLEEVARRLEDVCREEDSVGRYGGEEFLVILSITNECDIEAVAERYRARIEAKAVVTADNEISVTLSVGVGIARDASQIDLSQLINLADQALYEAKDAGRNQVKVKEAEEQ